MKDMKTKELINREILSTSEIKKIYGISRYELKKKINMGVLTALKLPNGQKLYFRHQEIKNLFIKNEIKGK